MRILVTGSRTWPKYKPAMIGTTLLGWALGRVEEDPVTVVVGYDPERERPHGVDQIAYETCLRGGVRVECYPADWDAHGKAAGPIRNQKMVDSGADLCLAFFWYGRTPGTGNCADLAEAAGIPVYEILRR